MEWEGLPWSFSAGESTHSLPPPKAGGLHKGCREVPESPANYLVAQACRFVRLPFLNRVDYPKLLLKLSQARIVIIPVPNAAPPKAYVLVDLCLQGQSLAAAKLCVSWQTGCAYLHGACKCDLGGQIVNLDLSDIDLK